MKKILTLVILCLCLCCNVFAKSFTGEAMNSVIKDAEKEALRNALAQTIADYVDVEILNEKRIVLEDVFLSRAENYVNNCKTVTKEKRPMGVWYVMVDADIDTHPRAKLMTDLVKYDFLKVSYRNPRIAILINPYDEANAVVGEWTAQAIKEVLVRAGYENVVLGDLDKADIIVKGKAVAVNEGGKGIGIILSNRTAGTKYGRVTLTSSLYQIASGKTFKLAEQIANGMDVQNDLALQRAARKTGIDVAEEVVDRLFRLTYGPVEVIK